MNKRGGWNGNEADRTERQAPLSDATEIPTECNCPEGKCQPEKNIGMHCWRSGFDIRASDFTHAVSDQSHG